MTLALYQINKYSMQHQSTCVIILGMSRSGTSALAGVTSHLGVDFGGNLLGPRAGVNDLGFFEDRTIVRLNDNLRRSMDHLKDPLVIVPVEQLDNIDRTNVLLNQKFEDMLSSKSQSRLWGFKHPGTEDILPFWIKRLNNRNIEPVVLMTVRHPMECFLSHSKWDPVKNKVNRILAHWMKSNLVSEIYSRDTKRMILKYDDLVNNSDMTVDRIINHLGFESVATEARQQTMEFIRPDLKRNNMSEKLEIPEDTYEDLYSKCLELYSMLTDQTIDEKGINDMCAWYIVNVVKDSERFAKKENKPTLPRNINLIR
jgi:hypothetical protein